MPLWVKLAATLFLLFFVPVYWVDIGPVNFLWFSDIAVIVVGIALWLESRLLISMMAVGVLLPELAWSLDFFARLLTGSHLLGLNATFYMFTNELTLRSRVLSLVFHVGLPLVLLWGLYRLGYHRSAWLGQTMLAWAVLPVCYFVADPAANINWVYGFGRDPQTSVAPALYFGFMMVFYPVVIYIPSHFLINWLFGRSRPDRPRGGA